MSHMYLLISLLRLVHWKLKKPLVDFNSLWFVMKRHTEYTNHRVASHSTSITVLYPRMYLNLPIVTKISRCRNVYNLNLNILKCRAVGSHTVICLFWMSIGMDRGSCVSVCLFGKWMHYIHNHNPKHHRIPWSRIQEEKRYFRRSTRLHPHSQFLTQMGKKSTSILPLCSC